ncbi:MAG: PucR family transcriptional regulator ligand-binding domain-containing protein [Bacillota bacterium]
MSITLRQAMEIGPLRKAKVVAGQGLDREITFVNIMEVPDVVRWMKGGELLLTAGFALKDDAGLRRRLIFDLAQKGVAAFGIKQGQYFNDVPADMIQCANQLCQENRPCDTHGRFRYRLSVSSPGAYPYIRYFCLSPLNRLRSGV